MASIRHHPQQSVLKPHDAQRQTACMRYISAPHRSHSILSTFGELRPALSGVMGRAGGGGVGSDMADYGYKRTIAASNLTGQGKSPKVSNA